MEKRITKSSGFSVLTAMIALVIISLAMIGVIEGMDQGRHALQSVSAINTFDALEASISYGVLEDVRKFWSLQGPLPTPCVSDTNAAQFASYMNDVFPSGLSMHLPASTDEWDNLPAGDVGGQGQNAVSRCRAAINPVGSDLSAVSSLYFCLMISSAPNTSPSFQPAVQDALKTTLFAFGEFSFFIYDTSKPFPQALPTPSVLSCNTYWPVIPTPSPTLNPVPPLPYLGYFYYSLHWANKLSSTSAPIYKDKSGFINVPM